MAEQNEYDDLLDGTVDDVKEDLGDYSRRELRDVLEAEKQGKDRKTLKEAIRNRMKDLEDAETDAVQDAKQEEYYDKDAVTESGPALRNPRKMLTAGLVLGVLVAVAAVFLVPQVQAAVVNSSPVKDRALSGSSSGSLSAAEAEQELVSYLEANKDAVFPPDTTLDVASSEARGDSLYTVNVLLTVGNQTQPVPFHVTADGQYLVSGSVFDMGQPLSEQIQQQAPQQQPQQQ